MSNIKLYSGFRTHSDEDGDWIPEAGHGLDVHHFTIPEGKQYSSYSVEIVSDTMGSGYNVSRWPQPGETGALSIEVDWWFNRFGKIAYILNVFGSELAAGEGDGPLTVYSGETNWIGKTRNAIEQGLNLRMVLPGPQGKGLFDLIRWQPGVEPKLEGEGQSTVVALSMSIVLGIITVSGYAAIGAILIFAMHKNYQVSVKHVSRGPLPTDEELIFEVTRGTK